MDELDTILLDQYHRAKRSLKMCKRHRILLKDDPELARLERQVLKTMQFLEEMINDKTILHKKPGKRKKTEKSVFCSNPWFEAYKTAFTVTAWSTRLAAEYTQGYLSHVAKFWRLEKNKSRQSSDNT
jgi:hypothetical protein